MIVLSHFANICRKNHYAINLFAMKRMSGPNATLGVVSKEGKENHKTMADLIEDGLAPASMAFLDRFLPYVPTIGQGVTEEAFFALYPSHDNMTDRIERCKKRQELEMVLWRKEYKRPLDEEGRTKEEIVKEVLAKLPMRGD